jgi:hypothetical protein
MAAQILVIKALRPPLHILRTGSNNHFPGFCCLVTIKGWDIPYLDTKHSLSYELYLRLTGRTVLNIITSSSNSSSTVDSQCGPFPSAQPIRAQDEPIGQNGVYTITYKNAKLKIHRYLDTVLWLASWMT